MIWADRICIGIYILIFLFCVLLRLGGDMVVALGQFIVLPIWVTLRVIDWLVGGIAYRASKRWHDS